MNIYIKFINKILEIEFISVKFFNQEMFRKLFISGL